MPISGTGKECVLKTLKKALSLAIPTVLIVGGAAAISVGVGLISLPAGIIAGGVLAVALGVLEALGGADDAE